MSPRKRRMKWIRWWIEGTLDGPLITQLSDGEFGIRAKLLLVTGFHAGIDCTGGNIGFSNRIGYTVPQLAVKICSPPDDLQAALIRFQELGICSTDPSTGVITMLNWKKYQSRYDDVRK